MFIVFPGNMCNVTYAGGNIISSHGHWRTPGGAKKNTPALRNPFGDMGWECSTSMAHHTIVKLRQEGGGKGGSEGGRGGILVGA